MTLQEIAYMILEAARSHHIVDDENIDVRLIYDWIDNKRGQYIKNISRDPNGRIALSFFQRMTLTLDVQDLVDAGDYPYLSIYSSGQILSSDETVPNIIENNSGPMIYSIESEDKMKLPYSLVDYGHLKIAGSGKFNSTIIYAAYMDNKMYFKYDANLEYYSTVILRAVFEKPRDITGFTVYDSTYPATPALIEYIKNGIFDKDFRLLALPTDDANDASGVITK